MSRFFSAKLAVLATGFVLASTAFPQSAQLKVRGLTQYIHATNLPWLDGRYSNDLGHNPLHVDWGYGYNSSHVDSYFADMRRMNMNVVRVWVHEDLEGLTFDSNGYVSGIESVFLSNLDDMFAKANSYKLSLYLTLFTFDLKDQFGQTLPNGATIKNFVNDSTARQKVLDNCVGVLASRYKANSALFGFDLINESNIGADNGSYTWANMRLFGSAAASKIHSVSSSIQVTMSTQWLQALDPANFAGSYGGLGFNFYDMHDYTDSPNLEYTSSMGTDKPVLLGECGQSTDSDSAQNTAVSAFLSQAASRGWAGCEQWAYDYPGSTDMYRLVNSDGTWRPAATTLQTYGANLSTFTGSASCANSVRRGTTLTITGSYQCTKNRLADAIVDMEVYNSSGSKVAQTWWSAQDWYQGDNRNYQWQWAIPSNLPTGSYHVAVAVFGPNWTPCRLWNGSVKTFTITS